MAKQNRTTLKTYFQQGDIPTQQQYVNLIDSQLNLHDGETQIVSGSVSASNFISNSDITVSGNLSSSGNLIIGHITSSGGISTTNLNLTHITSSGGISTPNISASLAITTDKIITGSAANGFTLVGDITASNDISASGAIKGDSLTVNTFNPTNITASGDISASGAVYASTYYLNNKDIANVTGTTLRLGYNTSHTKISLGRSGTTAVLKTEGNITSSGAISSSGTIAARSLDIRGTAADATVGTIVSNEVEGMVALTLTGSVKIESGSVVLHKRSDTLTFTGSLNFAGDSFNSNHLNITTIFPTTTINTSAYAGAIKVGGVSSKSVVMATTSVEGIDISTSVADNNEIKLYIHNIKAGYSGINAQTGSINLVIFK